MHPETLKSDIYLGIRLDSDIYSPGDTITGHIYRSDFISTRNAFITCCLHGEAAVVSGQNTRDDSVFILLSCHQMPDMLHSGPLHIKTRNQERQWPFSFEIPLYADSTENEDNRSASYMPVGATDHVLPPTYGLNSPGGSGAFVHYFVSAKLVYIGHDTPRVLHALHPFKLIHYSPNPPIADFALKRWRHPHSVRCTSLIPGKSLSHWIKRTSRRDDPVFTFDLLFELPTIIQLDNPTSIPLRLVINPNWEETSEIIQNVPQKVRLTSIEIQLVTYTKVLTPRMGERRYTKAMDLGVSKAMEQLRGEIHIPCTSQWDPVDIGEMIRFRIGLQETRFPFAWSAPKEFTPSFRTYNMTVTHKLKWTIQAKVAGESFCVKGQADLLLLRSSDAREHSGQDEYPSPVYVSPDTGSGLPESGEDEEDDSWIIPPPEEEAPPSFADAMVMGRHGSSER